MSYSLWELLEEQKRRNLADAVAHKEAIKQLTDAELAAKIREEVK